jgi:CO/xanthine dehydrogenase FAD-binding subunit
MVTFYRRLPKFDHITPRSLKDALDLLKNGQNGQYKVYAGGTDVIPKLKARLMDAPKTLVDLKGIPNMDYIQYDPKTGLRIGALATIFSVAHAPIIKEKYPILAMAANSIASVQIQNRGTLVGNICNAIPSADSAPALLCLGAHIMCKSTRGKRSIEMDAFFKGPNETVLTPEELVTEIQVPPLPEESQGIYIKLSPRSRMDLAVVGVAVMTARKNGSFQDIRIGLGAVAPTPIRAVKAEQKINGETVRDSIVADAAKIASEECSPLDDHRASSQYRRMMVEVLVKRAIQQILVQDT